MNGKIIGITSTIPSEIIYASGKSLCDLNNIYITSEEPMNYFEKAEIAGFPNTYCGWIKGLYSVAIENKISDVVAVTQGDCSNTEALMELYRYSNIKTYPFAYPYSREKNILKAEMDNLMASFDVSNEDVQKKFDRFAEIRLKLHKLDRMTYETGKISGEENHIWLVSSSDFNGNPDKFEKKLDGLIKSKEYANNKYDSFIRLGYIGVPPIITDFYRQVEQLQGHIVFNEVQRQFAMPSFEKGLYEQYLDYTYPYDIFRRIEDIKREIKKREIRGLIHYVQSFCFRTLEDLIIRKEINIPILTIEGDKPQPMDARTKIRLEAFTEMLRKQ